MPEEESEHIKEVYSWFGLAIFQCNCVERQLAMLLAILTYTNPEKTAQFSFDDILDQNFKRTLGRLFHLAEMTSTVPEILKLRIFQALDSLCITIGGTGQFNSTRKREGIR